MRRDLHARRRHFFNKKVSLVNYLSSQTQPEDMLVDDSATRHGQRTGQSLTEMEVHGHFFGACSLTVVVVRPRRAAPRSHASPNASRRLPGTTAALYEETLQPLECLARGRARQRRAQSPPPGAAQHERAPI